jgi:hypothetical protein
MIVRLRLLGLEILGLPTKNFYGVTGSFWNYLIWQIVILVDTGRTGQETLKKLKQRHSAKTWHLSC